MYILVNKDLDMWKCKIGAQVGHVVEMMTNAINKMNKKESSEIYNKYLQS